MKKVLFIINKFSGTGYNAEAEGRIIQVCKKHNVECIIEFTGGRGHATELARQATNSNIQTVIAVGGDGTINETAQGLLESKTPLGIIPKGSGNGLARHLGIPLKFSQALDSLFSSEVVAMDVFHLNDKLSLNVSGIGFDGHIANLFGSKTKRGLAGYTKLTMLELLRFQEFKAELIINNETLQRKAFIIAVANSSQYGNNARIVPRASVCDQLLHVNILRKVPAYRFDFVYSFFSGQADKSKFCEILETQKLHITTGIPMAYHVDGEPCGTAKEFKIELSPAALNVLAPVEGPRRAYL